MKKPLILVVAAVALAFVCGAQEALNNAKNKPLTPEEQAAYAKMNRREVELSAQIRLCTEFAEDLLKRASDVKTGLPERAKWLTEVAQELRDKAAASLKDLNDTTAQRVAFDGAHGPATNAVVGNGALDQPKPLTADEFVYVNRLEERTLKIRQDLTLTLDYGRTFALQLATNNTPEAVAHVSAMVDENNAMVRILEREEADLELRKLEFRALRR
jgi:hypothetical protein